MTIDAPPVDPRSKEDVALQVRRLLGQSLHGWPGRPSGGAADALIGVFAQLCGIVIDRLNKAPGKNLLAFLDMLGATPLPPEAARVPLTFYLAAQHKGHVAVPALTQVAAQLEKGEQQPVLFETERELVVTSAQLKILAVKEDSADRFDFHSAILYSPAYKPVYGGVSMVHATQPLRHELYLDLAVPSPPPAIQALVCQRLGLSFELAEPAQRTGSNWLQWELPYGDALAATLLKPASDGTDELSKSGEIVFDSPPPIAQTEVHGCKGYWLRCRTMQPLTGGLTLPAIRTVTVSLESAGQNLAINAALANGVALDPTKDFFPFGQRPVFGDTLYLACLEAFSRAGATVTINIVLTNPASGGNQTPIPPVAGRSVRLSWELWDGTHWVAAGVSEQGRPNQESDPAFSDSSRALTESGAVTLQIPPAVASLKMAGQNNFWLRVRLVGGDFGHAAVYERGSDGKYAVTPASFAPPAISAIAVGYSLKISSPPKTILSYNDFTFSRVALQTAPFHPFEPPSEPLSRFYFGFAAPRNFSDRSMSIYFGIGDPVDRKAVLDMAVSSQVALVWEYWNGKAWTKWTVVDDTDGFRRSGVVRFLAPQDFSVVWEFGILAHWLRVRIVAGPAYEPRLRLVALNTTMASQGLTCTAEVLGTSNGTPGQRFRTTKSPILAGEQLEVLEPAMPSRTAQRTLREDEGDDAIRPAEPGDVRGSGFWVRWKEVPNFNGSAAGDRHYVIDREIGEVVFGDGKSGRIPAVAPKNIVMARYRTGGGASGNRAADSIKQLKTAVPSIDSVTNPEPASGGADTERIERLIDRAPRQLRHGGRAVTAQDFEDLAMLASPEVRMARCIPLFDLAQEPDAQQIRPGLASVIIAPVGDSSTPFDRRPMPSVELIRKVRNYLDEHRLTAADLVIVGPEYVAIKVETEVTVSDVDTASEVELSVSRALSRYLHPAIGGPAGGGWQFGHEPSQSDLYSLIEGIPGVDHVRELKLTRIEDRPGVSKTGNFLICAAEPKVTVTLEK